MNNRIIKLISLIFLLAAIVAVSVSCGDKKTDQSETEGSTKVDSNTETDEIKVPDKNMLIENGKVKYCLICPIRTDKAIETFAKNFTEAFETATGLKIKTFDDYLEEGQSHDPDAYEILIGKTNYAESQEVFEGMRYKDVRIATKGRKLVVAAFTEEQYTEAFTWLKENIIDKIDDKKNYELKAQTYEHQNPDYKVNSWTIAGNDISKYRLVYTNFEILKTIEDLRQKIADISGYYLDIVEDKATDPSEYEILFGDTNRAESEQVEKPDYIHYTVKTVGNKLVVRCGGLHSLNKFSGNLVDLLVGNSTDVSIAEDYSYSGNYIDDPYQNTQIAEGADIRVMSCNILAEWESYNGRIPVSLRKEVFFAALDYYQPTIIGLQEFSPAWFECVGEYHDFDKYEVMKYMSPNGKDYYFSTIMYRKDLLEVVDQGCIRYSIGNNARGRCLTWGVFKVKATGKTFSFTSTHLDGFDTANTDVQINEWAETVQRLRAYGSVISVADWNTSETMNDYNDIKSIGDVVDFKYDRTENVLNQEGSYHDLGIMLEGYGLSLDHIFGTKDAICKKFETLIFNEQIWGSDHSWLLGDIQVK